jgi:hypothetical protein
VAHDPVRGVATSGWRGRSHSLGIADSVTVLAATAAEADAAATMMANAVNVDDARIVRGRPAACATTATWAIAGHRGCAAAGARQAVRQALDAGPEVARELQARGLIHAALLVCQGVTSSAARPDTPLSGALESTNGVADCY